MGIRKILACVSVTGEKKAEEKKDGQVGAYDKDSRMTKIRNLYTMTQYFVSSINSLHYTLYNRGTKNYFTVLYFVSSIK